MAIVLLYWFKSFSVRKHVPPGPKARLFIGNLFDIPTEAPWKIYASWGKKYGNIIYLTVMQKSLVVINSATIAHDLLDKRSAIYSSRPHVPMAGDVIGWSWALPLVPYGETFKRHRRYLQQYFSKQCLPTYYPIQLREARRLLKSLLDDPEHYKLHIERMAGAIIMDIIFGHEVKSNDDIFLQVASKGGRTIAAAGAVGAHIVDLIPILRFIPDWLPGASFKRLPPGTREDLAAMRHMPFNTVKRKMAEGTAKPCYISTLLEDTNFTDEKGVQDTGANVYSGDIMKTLSAIMSAMLALVADPIIQARAQAELDTVIGRNRLPDLSDRTKLPYIQCIISETFRWGAVTPVGVPHCLTRDDEYNGFFIPAGSTVIANSWAMLHDPEIYPKPEKFNPDRFLTGPGRKPQPDPRQSAFGFGRRSCPGMDFAETTIWIFIVTVFHAFKITPATDTEGSPIPIDMELTEYSVRHPKPFKCDIRPRFPNSIALIKNGLLYD
ncbi:cytochrome P450 [Lentinula edodes]|nr:cytochrome P450 [Lentinula edodes]